MESILNKIQSALDAVKNTESNCKSDDNESNEATDWLTIAQLVNIEPDELPDAENLSDEQAKVLADSITQLWNAHHLDYDLPVSQISPNTLYCLLKKAWTLPVPVLHSGTWLIEFCSFDRSCCSVPEECSFCADRELRSLLKETKKK